MVKGPGEGDDIIVDGTTVDDGTMMGVCVSGVFVAVGEAVGAMRASEVDVNVGVGIGVVQPALTRIVPIIKIRSCLKVYIDIIAKQ